jgi:nucleoside diphosphate kinase
MENLQENPRFNGKIYGFRLKDFPNKTNPLKADENTISISFCMESSRNLLVSGVGPPTRGLQLLHVLTPIN